MICHLSFSHFSDSDLYSAPGFVHSDSITNWLQSCCVPGIRDPIKSPPSFFFKIRFVFKDLKMLTRLWDCRYQDECMLCSRWNDKWETVFLPPQSEYPKGRERIHNPNNSLEENARTTCLVFWQVFKGRQISGCWGSYFESTDLRATDCFAPEEVELQQS